MEEIRARVDAIVTDRDTAEGLKPWYGYYCKRPCFHDEYLQAFNCDNVTLVDTRGLGVERITENGVVVDGVEYELDCLIFATGFEVGTDYAQRTGFEVVGRDGLTLSKKWADGIQTFHGLHVRGFPNLFVESIAQSGLYGELPVPARRAGDPRGIGDRGGALRGESSKSRLQPPPKPRGYRRSWNGPPWWPSADERARPVTTTERAGWITGHSRAASSSAGRPNTPTF